MRFPDSRLLSVRLPIAVCCRDHHHGIKPVAAACDDCQIVLIDRCAIVIRIAPLGQSFTEEAARIGPHPV